jgi:hypothetical protein
MRARRLVAVTTVAVLGVLSLGACGKSAPDVAAYVGDTTYSVQRVDEIYDDAQTKYGDAVRAQAAQGGASPSPEQLRSKVTRQDVVNLLVSLELGKRVVAARQLTVADEYTPEEIAEALQVPAAAQYVGLWGEWLDIYTVLSEKLPPAELSDESVMAVYDALAETGAIRAGLPVAEVRTLFGEGGFVRSASALGAALQEEAERAGTSVNPQYRPLAVPAYVPTQQGPIFYALPYIDKDGPVLDLSTPAPAAPGA